MTLQELQNQALQLPVGERWQLVQALLESLKQDQPELKQRNLSQLRGIANSTPRVEADSKEEYGNYLAQKYQ